MPLKGALTAATTLKTNGKTGEKVRPTTLMGSLSAALQMDEEEAAGEPD